MLGDALSHNWNERVHFFYEFMNWVIAEEQQSRARGRRGSNAALQETQITEPEELNLKGPLDATDPNPWSRSVQPDAVAHGCVQLLTVSKDELGL